MNIRPLTSKDFNNLHTCWNSAFSDYYVREDLSEDLLHLIFKQNGLCYEASVGLFDKKTMVGFVLNGVRLYNGVLTAYDTGTAIIKDYRGKGFAKNLFASVEKRLKLSNIKKYLLEVITENDNAKKLYLNSGFKIIRTLECFKTMSLGKLERSTDIIISNSSFKECEMLSESLIKYKPCWSNSLLAIRSVSKILNYAVARFRKQVVGFAVFNKATGRITQIGANSKFSKDAYAGLITHIFESNKSNKGISFINIPSYFEELTGFLNFAGFQKNFMQFEMEKNIK